MELRNYDDPTAGFRVPQYLKKDNMEISYFHNLAHHRQTNHNKNAFLSVQDSMAI